MAVASLPEQLFELGHFIQKKGHAGHAENETSDQLALAVAKSGKLEIDAYFENPTESELF